MPLDANILPITINLNFATSTARARDGHETGPTRLSNVPPLGPGSSVFSYLSCHTKASEFHGRDDEVAELLHWAQSADSHPIRFVTGPGGAGKTRLAIKVGEDLIEQGWSAQFISLDNSGEDSAPLTIECAEGKKGTLLLLDYPEAHFGKIDALLKAFAHHYPRRPQLRLLLLTRGTQSDWAERIGRCKARNLTDNRFITLAPGAAPITPRAGKEIINSTMQAVAAHRDHSDGTLLRPVTEEAVAAWMEKDANDLHKLPLFLVAAGVHSAMFPDDVAVLFSGPEILQALVDREIDRLRDASMALGAQTNTLPRILATATMAGGLTWRDVANSERLQELCEIPATWDNRSPLLESGWLVKGKLDPVTPDIVGAKFVHTVLDDEQDAPELAWEAVRPSPKKAIQSIARLAFDLHHTLELAASPSKWLMLAVAGKIKRCRILDFMESEDQCHSLGALPLVVSRTMLPTAKSPGERADRLTNLSSLLAEAGDTHAALAPALEAVEIYNSLMDGQSREFLPGLATSLNNLGIRMAETGDVHAALANMQKAVDIRLLLIGKKSQRFLSDLAGGLSNLGALQANSGDAHAALISTQMAVSIRRSLAEVQPQRFLPDLAGALNNLGNQLAETGDARAALAPMQEAMEAYRSLADAQPELFLPELAMSLNNMGALLAETGNAHAALVPMQETVNIRRSLAKEQPQRFLPDLAGSLNNLGILQAVTGAAHAALTSTEEAVKSYRSLTKEQPIRFLPDLATSLNNLGNRLAENDDAHTALAPAQEAVNIQRSLAKELPQRFLPKLGNSLGTLGIVHAKAGNKAVARATFAEGMEIMRPFAEQFPGSLHEALFLNLKQHHDALS